MNSLSLEDLGLVSEQTSDIPFEHVQALAATLDACVPDAAAPLPLLWHWAFFAPTAATAQLGPDGHPRRESPVMAEFPRRMWIGGAITANAALFADRPARRRIALVSHALKSGSTGDLLIVNLEHTIEQGGAVVITERQDVVYRAAGAVTAAPGNAAPPANGATDVEVVHPSEALLFRFSAVTFNSHRIHYDHAYATGVEHYPGLVVHGPLTAMLLAASASRRLDRQLQSFTFRAAAPLFVDQPISIAGSIDSDGPSTTVAMTATRLDGVTAMTATAG